MYLEPLFQYIKENKQKGMVELSLLEVERIIGEELSSSARVNGFYWQQPRIKRLMAKYNIEFSYLNTFSGLIYFKVS